MHNCIKDFLEVTLILCTMLVNMSVVLYDFYNILDIIITFYWFLGELDG